MFLAPGGWNNTLHSITILHRTVGKAPPAAGPTPRRAASTFFDQIGYFMIITIPVGI